ncbi:hypothetical protein IBL26_15290 [Roseomonas aerophila]|uniref:Uncharacterized protein n=1 Tax=Teichococcus aerophilus TaxID=1224513 RepID=A0ABR7RQ76_9PROT|nr:hypothetical protein [Pseudoroseomonas aerophila]MBC9208207.1 hypothetical protein [Pseudoroseomonas aerophila]
MSEARLTEDEEDQLEELLSVAARELARPAAKILKKPEISRDDLHVLLDVAIDLQQLATTAGGARVGAIQFRSMEVGNALISATFSWLNDAIKDPNSHNEHLSRSQLSFSVAAFPSTLPPHEREALSSALFKLDSGTGELPDFLTPKPKTGRGPDPERAHFAEKQMWFWIAIQTGQGIPSHIAEQQVAASVGLSINAVRAWRAAWVKRESKDVVASTLDHMKQAGARGSTSDFPKLSTIAARWRRYKGLAERQSPSS